jgi:hypothetical protein
VCRWWTAVAERRDGGVMRTPKEEGTERRANEAAVDAAPNFRCPVCEKLALGGSVVVDGVRYHRGCYDATELEPE